MPVPRGWHDAYVGTLRSRETYLGGDPVEMNAEITRRDCNPGRSQVFYLVSSKPRSHPDWEEMRRARERVTCAA